MSGEADDLARSVLENPTRVVVVGGGAAGLVAAREIARPGFEVTVVEGRSELGGSVARHELAGVRLDAGAESFATRGGHVAELLGELGLSDDIVSPLEAGAWLQLPGRAVPTPKAGILGIPSSPLAEDVIAAIGWKAAFRAYYDRLFPPMKIGKERNLGRLVQRRMGRAVVDNLVAPVTTGVYSASPYDLDVAVAAPGLNEAMTRAGSLSGAVSTLRGASKAGSAVGGIRGGMARLIDALAEDAVARGTVMRTGVTVAAVRPADAPDEELAEDDGPALEDQLAASIDSMFGEDVTGVAGGVPALPGRWKVRLSDGAVLDADVVVLAVPADTAVRLMAQASESLAPFADLEWPAASTVDIVTLVVDDDRLDAAPRGTGLLVAETVPVTKVAAKAMTHVTAKWTWVAEQLPAGRHVLRLSYGRAGSPSPLRGLRPEEIRARAVADASTLLNIPIAESSVVASDVVRWTNALPVAAKGERERIDSVLEAVEKVDGLEVTGSWITGTGLASVVPDARKAAERVRALRWKMLTED